MDDAQRIAQLIVQGLEEGRFDEKAGLEEIADQFELSSRQIRRIVQKELGVPPIQLLLTRRLLLAKQLLTETTLTDYRSRIRQRLLESAPVQRCVQHALRDAADASPQEGHRGCGRTSNGETSTLQLSYRPPYDWKGVLAFLAARALKGVEHVTDSSYARTVQLGHVKGWIRVTQSTEEARAAGRIHPQPHARAACAAQPRSCALRSQRTA